MVYWKVGRYRKGGSGLGMLGEGGDEREYCYVRDRRKRGRDGGH